MVLVPLLLGVTVRCQHCKYDNCFASDSDGSVFLLKVKFDEVLAKLFAACIGIEKAEMISQRRYAKTHKDCNFT